MHVMCLWGFQLTNKTQRNFLISTFIAKNRNSVRIGQTSEMEPFAQIVTDFSIVKYFQKKVHLGCLFGSNCTSEISSSWIIISIGFWVIVICVIFVSAEGHTNTPRIFHADIVFSVKCMWYVFRVYNLLIRRKEVCFWMKSQWKLCLMGF